MPPSRPCTLCPRQCRAKRFTGETGYCGANNELKIARAALHYWEEPPISGERGSGAVFFSNCPLRCVYCQNHDISQAGRGEAVSVRRLADIFSELALQGALNINLVTATQYTEEVIEAVVIAREAGLRLPIIWNSSAYETRNLVESLAGTVDAWLFDYRYSSKTLAKQYSNAPDYPEIARDALVVAVQQAGKYHLDDSGLLVSGVVVRFLLLPGQLTDTINCLDTVYSLLGDQVCYSLMSQYTAPDGIAATYPELAGPIRQWDYDLFVDHALSLNL
ncbi:MAG: radical SAM protein, partial [Coriobacteriales bacterium]|nr:radical SAM protein [Coriobacteriales bacterium]